VILFTSFLPINEENALPESEKKSNEKIKTKMLQLIRGSQPFGTRVPLNHVVPLTRTPKYKFDPNCTPWAKKLQYNQ